MMAALREWLTSIVAVSMLLCVAQLLIPEGTLRKIGGFAGGLILLLVLLRPILGAEVEQLTGDCEDYRTAIEEQSAVMQEAQETELAGRIAQRTAAYISDKAEALKLCVEVQVETEADADGIPVPSTVEIRGMRSEELAMWMEQELDIPMERQVWHEEEN